MSSTPKFIPRNAPAFRHKELVAGNPVITRLESGVGNCFPGLEFDMRNLERRFFPFLVVDFVNDATEINIVEVDIEGARAAGLNKGLTQAYEDIFTDMTNHNVTWSIERITGDFGPFKSQTVTIADLNGPSGKDGRTPADAWTAVRLLKVGIRVDIEASRRERDPSGTQIRNLSGERTKYLDDDGSLAAIFQPGEMTQSLCSPWTHDFRDCVCYYWASNHPDVVLPPLPPGQAEVGKWNLAVPWERADRGTPEAPSAPATAADDDPRILKYYEINQRWQELDFVLEGREQRGAYRPRDFSAAPFANWPELEANLRFAAGVELAVIQEYISAAFSLNPKVKDKQTRDSVNAAGAEMRRVFISEMRHLRVVNDVLRALSAKYNPGQPFTPALRVASQVPGEDGKMRPVSCRPLTLAVLDDFVAIERPSEDVDGLYARILSTVMRDESDIVRQMIRSIMADGLDHFQTFSAMREWLSAKGTTNYLLDLTTPKPPPPEHQKLQATYQKLLETLRIAYATNLAEDGALKIADARMQMVGLGGLEDQCEALAKSGVLVTFDPIKDPDFAAINPPP